jgi:hypothetical protein
MTHIDSPGWTMTVIVPDSSGVGETQGGAVGKGEVASTEALPVGVASWPGGATAPTRASQAGSIQRESFIADILKGSLLMAHPGE